MLKNALMLILFISGLLSAATYYVSQSNGNDANNGLSQATAFRTIARANTAMIGGDTLYILPGEYRESVVLRSGSNDLQRTVISGLGSRENIKILGSDLVTNWQQYSGNVYRTTFDSTVSRCENIDRTNAFRYNITPDCWEDRNKWYTRSDYNVSGFMSSAMAGPAGVNAPGKYYYDRNTHTLYLWPFNSDNPNNHQIECSQRRPVSETGSSRAYVTLQNLTIMHGTRGITLWDQDHDLLIQNNEIAFNSGEGSCGENPAAIFHVASSPNQPNVNILNNKIHDQWSDKGAYPAGSAHGGEGIIFYNVRDSIIANNEIYNTGAGAHEKQSGLNNRYYNNIFHDLSGRGIYGPGNEANTNYHIYNNIFYNIKDMAIFLNWNSYGNLIYNNDFYNVHIGIAVIANVNNGQVNIWNNIFRNTNYSIVLSGWDYNGHIVRVNNSDYNDFYQFGSFGHGDVGPWTFAQYQSITGNFESHSIFTDPLFVNSGNLDFHLQSGSPARNAGIDWQDYDNDGNRAERINMGPYITGTELIGNGATPPVPSPSPSSSPSPSPSPSIIPSPSPSASPSPSPSPSASPSASPSISPSASPTCSPSISVDSTYSGYSVSTIDDGIINANGGTSTTWASGESVSAAHWVEKQFCSPTQISTATIWWAYNAVQSAYMTSQQVQVQFYGGSSWQTAASIPYPGSNQPISTVSFSPISASRWRLYQPINQGAATYASVMWLTEIELNAASSPSVSPTPLPCSENWSCTNWGVCTNSSQTRACLDLNSCGTTTSKPAELQNCTMPSPSPSINASVSPSASISPSASPTPCNESWSCTGWNTCSAGSQSRLCTDANNCNTTITIPPLTQGCTMPYNPPSGGSPYYPPSQPGTPTNTPSPSASIKPSPSPLPVSIQVVQIRQEIEDNINLIPEQDRLDIQDLVQQAETLQKQGRTDQALILLTKAKTKLNQTIADSKTKKAGSDWMIGALAAIIILAIGIYYFKKRANN
ncbi:MAG: right-handed parallel beta-helix repeat-containing protein [Candidatus Micrarchaeota archaeon]